MVFVDTGAWFALSVASDPDHAAAKSFVNDNLEPLVTTDYIVDELLTLFVVRKEKTRGIGWIRDVLGDLEIVRIAAEDFQAASQVYSEFVDKEWSFTDCTSYVVIRRLQISKVFSFDNHFRQFGIVHVLP